MAFSFSNWFKTKPGDEPEPAAASTATALPAGLDPAASGEETHVPPSAPAPVQSRPIPALKSVVPNSVRPVGPQEAPASQSLPLSMPSVSSLSRPTPPVAAPSSAQAGFPQARTISFPGGSQAGGFPQSFTSSSSGMVPVTKLTTPPRAAAPETEPKPAPQAPDVTINLELGDFVDKVPANLLKSGPVDRKRMVPFKASDLYSDLARGRAAVSTSAIYALCPDLFVEPISDADDVEVPLPLQKLVEQLSASLKPRADQVAEENVGEIETPFLQVALEDNARFPKAAPAAAPAPAPAPKPAPAPARGSGTEAGGSRCPRSDPAGTAPHSCPGRRARPRACCYSGEVAPARTGARARSCPGGANPGPGDCCRHGSARRTSDSRHRPRRIVADKRDPCAPGFLGSPGSRGTGCAHAAATCACGTRATASGGRAAIPRGWRRRPDRRGETSAFDGACIGRRWQNPPERPDRPGAEHQSRAARRRRRQQPGPADSGFRIRGAAGREGAGLGQCRG